MFLHGGADGRATSTPSGPAHRDHLDIDDPAGAAVPSGRQPHSGCRRAGGSETRPRPCRAGPGRRPRLPEGDTRPALHVPGDVFDERGRCGGLRVRGHAFRELPQAGVRGRVDDP